MSILTSYRYAFEIDYSGVFLYRKFVNLWTFKISGFYFLVIVFISPEFKARTSYISRRYSDVDSLFYANT